MGAWIISLKKRVSVLFLAFPILLFPNSLVYSQQWTSVPPPPVSTRWWLNGIHFTSPDEGWAVGGTSASGNSKGVLLHYSGSTWTSVRPPPVSISDWVLSDVYFTSPDEGWAVGWEEAPRNFTGVLLHYSGGRWTSVPPPPVSTSWSLGDVHFTSPDEGWAVGTDSGNFTGVLLHYSEGMWTSVPPPPLSINYWWLSDVYFTSPDEGWAVGATDFPSFYAQPRNGVLLHYSGGMWTFVPTPYVSTDWVLNGIHFTSPGEGWVVGGGPFIYSSDPTGILLHYSEGTLTSVTPPSVSTHWNLYGVHFTSSREGWAVGRGGEGNSATGVLLHYSYPILSVTKSGTGIGTVTSNPGGINCGSDCREGYNPGTVVTLTATPTLGSAFAGWSGACSDTGQCSVTMNADQTVAATFNPEPDLTGEWTTPVTQTCKSTKKGPTCTIRGTLTVKNVFNRDASSSTIKFYLSNSNTYDAGDTPLKSAVTGKIKAKQSKTINLTKRFPLDQDVKGLYIIAVIDEYNTVKEIDETNNIIVFGPIQ